MNDLKITKRGWYVIGLSIVTFSVIVNTLLADWNWYGGFK